MPLLSIVTVVRNDREGLQHTGASIAQQTTSDWEWIVVDGASSDGTERSGDTLVPRPDTWISEPDEGIYDAMNTGIAHSTGDWILFLNAGDTLCRSDTLSDVGAELSSTDRQWGFGAVRNIDASGSATGLQCASPFTLNGLLLGNTTVPHQATFMRTSLVRKIGTFSTSLGTEADQEYILRAARLGPPFELVWPVADFRMGGQGMQRSVGHFPKAMRRARLSTGQPLFNSRIADAAVTGAMIGKKYAEALQDSVSRWMSG
jgi:hypothetical protein